MTTSLNDLNKAIDNWHNHAIRFNVHAPDVSDGSRALSGFFKGEIEVAAKAYGDARVAEELPVGSVPPAWVAEAVKDAMASYLRICSSGGMRKKDIDLVKSHVQNMVDMNYVHLSLARRVLAARKASGSIATAPAPAGDDGAES